MSTPSAPAVACSSAAFELLAHEPLSTASADHADLTFCLFQESCVRDSNQMPTLISTATSPTCDRPSDNTKNCREYGFAT